VGNPSRSSAKIKKIMSEDNVSLNYLVIKFHLILIISSQVKGDEKAICKIPEAPVQAKPEPLKPLDLVPLEDLLTEIATNARNGMEWLVCVTD
jgi:hypothetical protein